MTKVFNTCPCNFLFSIGVFLDFDLSLSLLTTQGLLISTTHKSASLPFSIHPLFIPRIFAGFDVKQAIAQIQAGKVDYRVDKSGIVHASLGKASFSVEDLVENYQTLIATLVKAKPASSKGQYVKGISVSTTMGVGVRVAYTA